MKPATACAVELMGGPLDGTTLTYHRDPHTEMPEHLPMLGGYSLLQLDTRAEPPVWRYGWVSQHSGQKQPCSCTPRRRGCPDRRREDTP